MYRKALTYIRTNSEPMIANLRDASGKNPDEILNHAVYMYESRMVEAHGDDEKVVEVTTVITANVFPLVLFPLFFLFYNQLPVTPRIAFLSRKR
jgi:hypothetical protein